MANGLHLKVVFFGTSSFVIPVLSQIEKVGWLEAVVTAPDSKAGRRHQLAPSPVKAFLQGHPYLVFTPEKFDQEIIEKLRQLGPDLFVLASYGRMLPQEVLDIPRFGSLNIHPSLLPKYRGPSPIQNAILNGDKTSGVTIIKMDPKMDHGPVIVTKEIRLSDKETFESLSTKLFTEGAELLIEIIPDSITGKVKLKPQDDTEATFTHLIKKEDGYFDPPVGGQASQSFLEKLDRMTRAYYPWPTAWTLFRQGSRGQARIVKFLPKNLVQMEGKKPVPLEDFLRGYPDFPNFFRQ